MLILNDEVGGHFNLVENKKLFEWILGIQI